MTHAGAAGVISGQLEQVEFFGAVDCRPSAVDSQFVENVSGVGA